jgi:hypothetical protein
MGPAGGHKGSRAAFPEEGGSRRSGSGSDERPGPGPDHDASGLHRGWNLVASTTKPTNTRENEMSARKLWLPAVLMLGFSLSARAATVPDVYSSIQAAIDAMTTGTITVAAGTYTEALNIEGKTDLSIIGADKTTVIIQPSASMVLPWNVGSYGAARQCAVRIVSSTGISLSGVTLDCDLIKGNSRTGILFWDGTGGLDDAIVKNMSVPDGSGGYTEIGITCRTGSPAYTASARAAIAITNCEIIDTGRVGILTHDYVHMTIEGNEIYKTTDDFGYGMEIGSGSTAVIRNNTIYGYDTPAASDGSTSSGIYIENSFTGRVSGTPVTGVVKDVLMENNEVYGCQSGMTVGNQWDGYAGDVDIRLVLNGNNFHDNNEAGIYITDEDAYDGSSVTVTGGGNTFARNGYAAYWIYTFGDGALSVDLSSDTIGENLEGVIVADYGSSSTSTYSVAFRGGTIAGNTTYGIENAVAGLTVSAENIWWGDSTGPFNATSNPSGLGDPVSDGVDFSPWGGTDFAFRVDGTPGPAEPVTAYVDVTVNAEKIATVAGRLTYDALRLDPASVDIEKGAGIPGSWTFAFLDTEVAGQVDFVLTEQSDTGAFIAPPTLPFTFEAVKLTFERLTPVSCAPVTFDFNAVRPTEPSPTFNAFPVANQYVHVIEDGNVLTAPAGTLTPGAGPTVTDHAFIRGNVNARDAHALNISDVIDLASFLFGGYVPSFSCEGAFDVNDDGDKNITDLVTLVHGIFNPTLVTIPPPNSDDPGPGIPGAVVPDGGSIPSVLGCAQGETCP